MTTAQATELRSKWAQQDPPLLCEHPIQELAHLAQSDDGYTAGMYYCRTCGEALVRTYKVPAFSTSPHLKGKPEVPSPSPAPAMMPLPDGSLLRWRMPVFTLLALFLLPISGFAQSVLPLPQGGNITVIPNALGASYWMNDLSRLEVIGKEPSNQMYFSYDRYGQANEMGFLNQPFVDRPLTVPESLYQPNQYDRPSGVPNRETR